MVPLGVFAMLVAGWYIQTRAAIAHVEAISRERVAAIEKGVLLRISPYTPRSAWIITGVIETGSSPSATSG